MKNPNIEIREHYKPNGEVIKYMKIDKEKENNDSVAVLSIAMHRLKIRTINFVLINNFIFTREPFEFKSSRNFNSTKAIELFIYQYEIEFYNSL